MFTVTCNTKGYISSNKYLIINPGPLGLIKTDDFLLFLLAQSPSMF